MLICSACNSWFKNFTELRNHKKRKECVEMVLNRSKEKKRIRAEQDKARRGKVTINDNIIKKVKSKNNKIELDQPKISISKIINAEADIKEEIVNDTNSEINESKFDIVGFRKYLVDECNIKIQKVSRAGEKKLKENFEEHLETFLLKH